MNKNYKNSGRMFVGTGVQIKEKNYIIVYSNQFIEHDLSEEVDILETWALGKRTITFAELERLGEEYYLYFKGHT